MQKLHGKRACAWGFVSSVKDTLKLQLTGSPALGAKNGARSAWGRLQEGSGCGGDLSPVKSSLGIRWESPRGVMLMGFSPIEFNFPAGSPLCGNPPRYLLNVPLQRVAEMGCCLSSQGSGKPHGVVQRLLQVLHSHATPACIELIFMAICLSSTWHNLRL